MTEKEKEALERRIDELCQENERLRELACGAANEADRLTHDAAALQIENAKLRELVSDYSDCLDTALLLAADAGYPVMPARDKFLSLEKRKRELGVVK